jgi:hypothetical protein
MAKSLISTLSKSTYGKAKVLMKNSFNDMLKKVKEYGIEDQFLQIINKNLKTKYKSLNDLSRLKEDELNEDFSNFWKMFKLEGWSAVAIFPTLSIWFEIDKLLDGVGIADLNFKKIVVYGTFWLFLILGKHIKGYNKWKREHPDEFEKEGKPGVFKKRENEMNILEKIDLYLDERQKASDILYGEDSFLSKIKRFFTLAWMEPMNGNKEQGIYTLKRAGFIKEEIKKIRDAVFIALGEAINKFGDAELAHPDDDNFSGWRINIAHPASGGVFSDKKIKKYVKDRVSNIIKKGK